MISWLAKKLYKPKARFALGEGKVLIQSGFQHGKPVLILSPAENVGQSGEDAAGKERSAQYIDVLRKSVILEFPSESHREAVRRVMLSRDLP